MSQALAGKPDPGAGKVAAGTAVEAAPLALRLSGQLLLGLARVGVGQGLLGVF
jgi:hypothetical protein